MCILILSCSFYRIPLSLPRSWYFSSITSSRKTTLLRIFTLSQLTWPLLENFSNTFSPNSPYTSTTFKKLPQELSKSRTPLKILQTCTAFMRMSHHWLMSLQCSGFLPSLQRLYLERRPDKSGMPSFSRGQSS